MNGYQLTFARSARKELEALPASVVARVFPRIEALRTILVPDDAKHYQEKAVRVAIEESKR